MKTTAQEKVREELDFWTDSLEVSEPLKDFLRQELTRYRCTRRGTDGKVIAVNALSGEILAMDERLEFSQETLRRFLAGNKQKLNDLTIRAIAKFLVAEEWLTEDEIHSRSVNHDLKAAQAMRQFLGIKPSPANKEFSDELAGRYDEYFLDRDCLTHRQWYIVHDEQSGVLLLQEALTKYSAFRNILILANVFHKDITMETVRHLNHRAAFDGIKPNGATQTTHGFGIADHRAIFFVCKDNRTGLPRLYHLQSVAFDSDDIICTLSGSLAQDWRAEAAKELTELASTIPKSIEDENWVTMHKYDPAEYQE